MKRYDKRLLVESSLGIAQKPKTSKCIYLRLQAIAKNVNLEHCQAVCKYGFPSLKNVMGKFIRFRVRTGSPGSFIYVVYTLHIPYIYSLEGMLLHGQKVIHLQRRQAPARQTPETLHNS